MYNTSVEVPALVTEDKILDSFAKYRCQVPSEMSQDTWEHCTKVADAAQVTEETHAFPNFGRRSGRTPKGH